MDIFDVLEAILKRKYYYLKNVGMSEKDALKKAEFDVSKDYNILLNDIKKLNRA